MLKDFAYMKFKVQFTDFTAILFFLLKEYLKYETKREEFVEYDRSFIIGGTYEHEELDCARKISIFLFYRFFYFIVELGCLNTIWNHQKS